ncbi:MAG: hypothetical protein R3C26_12080 [Calditrichia bacterium]
MTQLSIELKSPHFSLSRGMIAQIVWELLGQTPVRLQMPFLMMCRKNIGFSRQSNFCLSGVLA